MVHCARTNDSDLPVGFHCTALYILKKYGLEKYWNNIPNVSHNDLKAIFKKPIWDHHWKIDIASATSYDSPFSLALSKGKKGRILPKYPYKSYYFLDSFTDTDLSCSDLSSILRFWMTPPRQRVCSCTLPTSNIAKHLIFECQKTCSLVSSYRATLSSVLQTNLQPDSLELFFSGVACSADEMRAFNRLVGKFEYPRF